MAKKQTAKKPGTRRKTKATKPIAEGIVTRCPKCGSSDREPYSGVDTKPIAGIDRDGNPFTHVIWSRTKCRACGQARIDRRRENRV